MRVFLLVTGICLLVTFPVVARIGGGEIDLKVVTFSHEWHVKEMGLSCTKCHPKLFLTTAKRKSVKATVAKCTTCHGKKW